MKKKRFRFQWGAFLMIILYGGLFFALLLRMFSIQATGTVEGVELAARAAAMYKKEEVLTANRGKILDQNGSVIAEDTLSYKIYAVVSEKASEKSKKPRHVIDPKKTARILAEYIPMSEEKILEVLQKGIDNPKTYQVEFGLAGRNISHETMAKIEKEELPGINFVTESKRYYPNGIFASHLIGYAAKEEQKDGSVKTVGKMGIESYYNDVLTGKDGKLEYESDVKGYLLPNSNKNIKEAEDGDNIYLTIDKTIQNFLEESMAKVQKEYKPESMVGIVADAKTGEILAASQRPTFNPDTKEGINTNWLNKITQDVIEPGSTMKTFTISAAIDSGHWHPQAYYSSGRYTLLGSTIGDHNYGMGWGKITFLEGFQRSSNTMVANVLEEMGNKTLIDYFEKFGFGKKTGIDLPDEATGHLLTKYPINYVTTSYGQGSTVTPIQLVQAMTAITNDGEMVQPYFIKKIVDGNTGEVLEEGKRKVKGKPISKNTAKQMKELLLSTVTSEHGTAKGFKIDGYEIAGKTGTAQIPNPKGGGYIKDEYLFSFLGFAPVDNPQIIVYVAIKSPHSPNGEYGSVPVSKVFKPVAQNSLKYLNIKPENTKKTPTIKMGEFKKENAKKIQKQLKDKGINVVIIGNGGKIIEQYPKKGTVMTKDTVVFLKTAGKITLPSMKNWSLRNVLIYKSMSGLSIEISGQGYVTSQSVSANTVVKDKSPIVVKLKTPEEKYKQNSSKKTEDDLPKD